MGGIWPEAQSLHGRSRSQGCGSQDAPRQVSLESTGRWVPTRTAALAPPTHTGRTLPAVSVTPGLIPGDRTACLRGFPPRWDAPPAWSQPFPADWLFVNVWGTCDQSSSLQGPAAMPPSWFFLSLQLSGKPPAAAWNTGVLEAEPTLSRSSCPRPGLSLPPSASGPSSTPRPHLPPGLSPVLGSCVQRSL